MKNIPNSEKHIKQGSNSIWKCRQAMQVHCVKTKAKWDHLINTYKTVILIFSTRISFFFIAGLWFSKLEKVILNMYDTHLSNLQIRRNLWKKQPSRPASRAVLSLSSWVWALGLSQWCNCDCHRPLSNLLLLLLFKYEQQSSQCLFKNDNNIVQDFKEKLIKTNVCSDDRKKKKKKKTRGRN